MTETTHTCPNCTGTGRRTYRTSSTPCAICATSGTVTINPTAIQAALLVTRGAAAGTFRRSRPKLTADGGVYGAAYVWRMIRFHAGLDMHLPITASWHIGVWRTDATTRAIVDTLDALTDTIGEALFGKARMMRAGARWGAAMYGTNAPITDPGPAGTRTLTYGELATALGVAGIDGLDIGGFIESPEAAFTNALDLDGNLDPDDVDAIVTAPARPDHS